MAPREGLSTPVGARVGSDIVVIASFTEELVERLSKQPIDEKQSTDEEERERD
jgi:hypothetical protein